MRGTGGGMRRRPDDRAMKSGGRAPGIDEHNTEPSEVVDIACGQQHAERQRNAGNLAVWYGNRSSSLLLASTSMPGRNRGGAIKWNNALGELGSDDIVVGRLQGAPSSAMRFRFDTKADFKNSWCGDEHLLDGLRTKPIGNSRLEVQAHERGNDIAVEQDHWSMSRMRWSRRNSAMLSFNASISSLVTPILRIRSARSVAHFLLVR